MWAPEELAGCLPVVTKVSFLASFPSGFCVHSEMQTVFRDDSKLCPSPGNDKCLVTLTQVLVSC